MELGWNAVLSLDILQGVLTALNSVFGTGRLEFNLSGYLLPVAVFVFLLAKSLYSPVKHRSLAAFYNKADQEVLYY